MLVFGQKLAGRYLPGVDGWSVSVVGSVCDRSGMSVVGWGSMGSVCEWSSMSVVSWGSVGDMSWSCSVSNMGWSCDVSGLGNNWLSVKSVNSWGSICDWSMNLDTFNDVLNDWG